VERPVWAFFAFYLVARNVKLFGGVALSAAARTDYLTIAITGQNDLVKLAERTGVALTALAAMTAIVFLVVPLGVLALALRKPE
jgi:predicted nuclease of restriction endonuclease-like RecB superfamily